MSGGCAPEVVELEQAGQAGGVAVVEGQGFQAGQLVQVLYNHVAEPAGHQGVQGGAGWHGLGQNAVEVAARQGLQLPHLHLCTQDLSQLACSSLGLSFVQPGQLACESLGRRRW